MKRFTISILPHKIRKKKYSYQRTVEISNTTWPLFFLAVSYIRFCLLFRLPCYGPQWNKCWSLNGFWCVPSATLMQRIHQFQSTVFSRELFVIYYLIHFIMIKVCFLSAVQTEG